MLFNTAIVALAALVVPAFAAPSASQTVTVSYDTTYDNASLSLASVACSDGPNGLLTKHFTTIGSLPTKNVGGAAAISGWGSAECGTCWALTYNGVTVNVLAIDHAQSGFNVAESTLNALTDGQAVFLGRINAQATQVSASACGL